MKEGCKFKIMEVSYLIKKSIEGDSNSFNELVQPYLSNAYKTAYLILNDKNLAKDAVQEALYQTYKSLYRYNEEKSKFTTWFNKIVIHCTLKMKKKLFFFIEFKPEHYNKTEGSPEDNILLTEENKMIYSTIFKLSIKLRTVIILFYFQELSINEISKVLDISDGTVKSRLHKGRKKIEEILKKDKNFSYGGDAIWIKK